MNNADILALPMGRNDAEAATIRDYLKALLSELWREEESFSGKRPFGNSGWQHEVYAALIKGGAAPGTLDDDGYITDYDRAACERIVMEAIGAL